LNEKSLNTVASEKEMVISEPKHIDWDSEILPSLDGESGFDRMLCNEVDKPRTR
jgi:hypothetical protein